MVLSLIYTYILNPILYHYCCSEQLTFTCIYEHVCLSSLFILACFHVLQTDGFPFANSVLLANFFNVSNRESNCFHLSKHAFDTYCKGYSVWLQNPSWAGDFQQCSERSILLSPSPHAPLEFVHNCYPEGDMCDISFRLQMFFRFSLCFLAILLWCAQVYCFFCIGVCCCFKSLPLGVAGRVFWICGFISLNYFARFYLTISSTFLLPHILSLFSCWDSSYK